MAHPLDTRARGSPRTVGRGCDRARSLFFTPNYFTSDCTNRTHRNDVDYFCGLARARLTLPETRAPFLIVSTKNGTDPCTRKPWGCLVFPGRRMDTASRSRCSMTTSRRRRRRAMTVTVDARDRASRARVSLRVGRARDGYEHDSVNKEQVYSVFEEMKESERQGRSRSRSREQWCEGADEVGNCGQSRTRSRFTRTVIVSRIFTVKVTSSR